MIVRALLALLLLSSAAYAQSTETEAKQHFQRGQKLVGNGRFDEALREFEAGYVLSRRPLFLFNMGECARGAHDLVRAREHYEHYLAEDPNGAQAKKAHERIAEIDAGGPPAPASGKPDAAPKPAVAAKPEPTPAVATKPEPKPAASKTEATASAPAVAEAASKSEPASAAAASTSSSSLVAQAPERPARRPVWKRWPLWVGVGAAVAVTAIAVGVGVGVSSRGNGCTTDCSFVDLRH